MRVRAAVNETFVIFAEQEMKFIVNYSYERAPAVA